MERLEAESAVESANFTAESADSTTDSVIVGRLPLLNMFNILKPLESADGNRPNITVGRWEMSSVGTGLKRNRWDRLNIFLKFHKSAVLYLSSA